MSTEERSVVALVESFNDVVVVNNPEELLQVLAEPHPLHRQLALTHWKSGDQKITVCPTKKGAVGCVITLASFQADKVIEAAKKRLESN